MQARLEKKEDVTIVHLSGRIDYESADRFRETCLKILNNQKIVFDLAKLSFVGSSGITPFLETMTDLSVQNKGQLKFCRVGVEFKKVFEASSLKSCEIYEDVNTATISFAKPAEAFVEKAEDVLATSFIPSEYQIKE
ncbi:MAG: STAS domain-containing protein [Bdellovibrionales bacterium]|nr:STAS domain-containing protein [Bdellovibrionales bacterium]